MGTTLTVDRDDSTTGGLVVYIEEHKVADLKTVPVEQHQSMLQAIAKNNATILLLSALLLT